MLTVSDRVSAGEAIDASGPAAAALLEGFGFSASVEVVPDGVGRWPDSCEALLLRECRSWSRPVEPGLLPGM